MSSSVTSSGNSPANAASISPRSSRSSGAIHGSPTASYTSASSRPATSSPRSPSPSPTLMTPYSEMLSPCATARLRSLTLCSLDPEKYCSAAP